MRIALILSLTIFLWAHPFVQAQVSVRVAEDLGTILDDYLTEIAKQQWNQRRRDLEQIRTPAEIQERQSYVRARIIDSFGGFPETREPLNAKIVGTLERAGYRVEKLIYESLPNFFVTANIYVPTTGGKPPFPAMLITAGHGWTGKASGSSQIVCASLAQRGILTLAYDPVGQGERQEYYHPELGRSMAGPSPTREHMMADLPCRLTGGNFARYELWDGIRAVDYLQSRRDVDPKRIGVAGVSGGGTQAAYLAAVEPRLAAVASACYPTTWEALWAGPGPQDAEQSLTNFIKNGLDFGDFALVFAPRPFTILAAVRDYFPIEGARVMAAEMRHVYGILGNPEAAGFFEYDSTHGWPRPMREATYRWMQKWLNERPDDEGGEPDITPESDRELNCTPTGQVATSLKGQTVHSLNLALAERLFAQRTAARITDAAQLRKVIAARIRTSVALSGGRSPAPVSRFGEAAGEGYRMEKVALETEKGITVPALILVPSTSGRKPAVLYLNSMGKSAGFRGALSWDPGTLARAGHVVMAADLRGWGESAPRHAMRPGSTGYSVEYQSSMRALLVGKTLIGMQVDDSLRCFDYLASRPDVDSSRISVFGKNDGGVVALMAAALETRIEKVISERAIFSYMAIVRSKFHEQPIRLVVPGVLLDFDLQDVAAAIAPRPVWIVDPQTPTLTSANLQKVSLEYGVARESYERAAKGKNLRILERVAGWSFEKVYEGWIGKAAF